MNGHQWSDEREMFVIGLRILQHGCVRCGRDFGKGPDGRWRGMHVGTFKAEFLDNAVSEKLLAEPCPGQIVPFRQ